MKQTKRVKNTNQLSKKKELLFIGTVLFLTFILFSPALKNNFTNWDDQLYVTENNTITNISFDDLGKFGESVAGNFHPLTMLSLAIDYHFFELNPFYYHLKNILFHLLNTLLVFYFIKRITKNNLFVSLITALIFGIHPMHVESVAWVAERKDVLYTFYFLIGLLLYYQYLTTKRIIYFVATTISFVLSTLSKSAAVVFPVILILIDYFEGRKFSFKSIGEKIPLILISFYIGITAINTQSGAISDFHLYSFIDRIRFVSYGFMNYLVKFIYPHHLSSFHPYPEKGNIPATYSLALIAVLFLIVYLIFSGRKIKWLVFGIGFYFITIALVLQFFSVGSAIIAERYTYVPYIGIGLIYSTFLYKIFSENKYKNIKYFAGAFLILQLFVFARQTYNRTKIWHDPGSLWTDVIHKYPKLPNAYSNRGNYYRTRNNYDQALQDFNMAIKLDKKNDNAYYNRGRIFFDKGQLDLALADYNKCLAITPDFADALNNRGVIYIFKKEYDKALADLNKSLELEPENEKALADRGFFYFQLKEYGNSIKDNELSLKLDPDNPDVLNTNGLCYYYLQDYEKAIVEFNKCIALDATNCKFYMNRALALHAMGNVKNALKDALKAKELGCNVNPNFIKQLRQ